MKKRIDTFWRYRNLLFELVKKGIKLKYRRSYLGIIWSPSGAGYDNNRTYHCVWNTLW